MRGPRRRAREDTRGRLLAPARPASTPAPALRRSHFPDPPQTTLRPTWPASRSILQAVPGASIKAGPQPSSSAVCLTTARTGTHSRRRERHTLDIEGCHDRSGQTAAPAAARLPGPRALPRHRILVFGVCWGRPASVPNSGPLAHHQCATWRSEPGHARCSRRSASRRRTSWPQDWPSRCPSGAGMVSG
jgi:hypothetical protein